MFRFGGKLSKSRRTTRICSRITRIAARPIRAIRDQIRVVLTACPSSAPKTERTRNMEISGVTVYDITDPARFDQRAPTAAFTLEGYTPRQVAERLGEEGIFVWDGNYYALAGTERLGVEESGSRVLQHDGGS